ncbi:MAG TPA: Crp/Fnr family transcriptional regulator [Rubrobacter sp.]|nr:Crp/Fnr family transcriptional regulator [Rubrobacter sp.]
MLRERAAVGADVAASRYPGLEDFEDAGVRLAERRLGPRDLIFAPGDPDGRLYFLLEGTVRLYKIYGGHKEATVALLKDRGVFGELGLTEGSRQSAFAEALTGVRIAVARKPVLVEAIKRHPAFAMKLFSSFSERLKQSDEAIESLLSREVSARLVTLLLNLGDRLGETTGSGTILNVRLTHQDLANMIVSTREAVSKVMSELQRDGLIEVRNRRICLAPRLAEDGPSLPSRAAL